MATWALNLLRSSPFNSPAITLSRSCGAVGGGLRWKKAISVPNFFSSHLKPAPWAASSGRPPTSWCSWGCGWISTWCQSPCRRCNTRPASSTTALAPRPAVAWSRILPHKLVTSGRVWLVISCCSWYPGPAGEVGSVSRYNCHHCHLPPPPSKWVGWKRKGACLIQRKWWSNFCFRHKTLKDVKAKRGSLDEIMQVWHWLQLIESSRASLARESTLAIFPL